MNMLYNFYKTIWQIFVDKKCHQKLNVKRYCEQLYQMSNDYIFKLHYDEFCVKFIIFSKLKIKIVLKYTVKYRRQNQNV